MPYFCLLWKSTIVGKDNIYCVPPNAFEKMMGRCHIEYCGCFMKVHKGIQASGEYLLTLLMYLEAVGKYIGSQSCNLSQDGLLL